MIPQNILDELYNCMDCSDLKGFEKQVKAYLETTDESTASQSLASFIVTEYRAERADTIAKLMEIIIRCNPNLALINYPENHFFRIVIISGSMDLFDCLTEEAIEPYLENLSNEEYDEYYTKLLHLGANLVTLFADQYQQQIKGLHFNGAFAKDENNPNAVLINQEDYEKMKDIVDKFNTIIGRRDIMKALIMKAGMKLKEGEFK
jgi:hypothetical protein